MASLKEELKPVFLSALPIVSLVTILLLVFVGANLKDVFFFLGCVVMVIVGIATFFIGVEIGIIPASRAVGAEIPRRGSIIFLVVVVFAISFLVTIADPDVTIFTDLANSVFPSINKMKLVVVMSSGVGFILVISALRIVYNISQKLLFMIGYGIVLALSFVVPPDYFGMAFDSGGVSTGPINIPVLIALGLGLCSMLSSRTEMDGFGLVGMATIGPIIGTMLYCIFTGDVSTGTMVQDDYVLSVSFLIEHLISVIKDVATAMIPLVIFFIIFQRVFLKYPLSSMYVMVIGMGFAALGMILFLTGVNSGFLPVANGVGMALADIHPIIVIVLGFGIGFLVTFAEPAVKILAEQVEDASHGVLKDKLLIAVLALGVASFVAIGMAVAVYGIELKFVVIPGYILALILMYFTDKELVGVAFDAGGVATGPMAVTLVMTMYTGLALGMHGGGVAGSFGIIILMVMAPIIFVSALGVILRIYKERSAISSEEYYE
ncbi:MAG: DUF1538 domain-containing protein [Methanomassiliicoccaceae archaeon]|nr:DUF1538 domain-containing protein [Methanomassiliicoccaceae archaeon]